MCIKLVIKTNLYYDARSEKHQIIKYLFSHFFILHTNILDLFSLMLNPEIILLLSHGKTLNTKTFARNKKTIRQTRKQLCLETCNLTKIRGRSKHYCQPRS
jgi:hypothetical protein